MQNEAHERSSRLVTKSVRLDQDEAADLAEFARLVGESEASVLKRALVRGLASERLHRALAAFLGGATSSEAAEIAGLPRAVFLEEAANRGLRLAEDVTGLDDDLAALLHEDGLVMPQEDRPGSATASRR